ncbi:MAG: 50S ribosomal protein L10 [Alphaproteobacteria bacterium]|nr:50S ribosomal protein L10 [Alphaproteobacteria bacterium]
MSRAQKEAEVKELNERFANDELVVLTHYSGLSVKQLGALRSNLRAEGASFKVTKNSLAKLAVKGTKFEHMADMFAGPTGVASSQDPVAAAKIAYKFAKDNDKLVILGGALGEKILDADAIKQLASLPSMDEIRSKLVGLLVAAPTKLAGILQAPARDMVGVTKAYGATGE